ncbi:PTS sugar transporter subunit IIA [Brenneria roseae subsp. americana]|uniref:PTS sugar transporter subunit IIA n=1 Tax=Brenneria roseae subsp. americana TaxID=1508507 RepID=A0A2U1TQM3_9GAMM|nr:PTS sugar transporter subunit IIA [Brenneria roseae]PWC11706.1 PTS sugar transporter subunit IIA [Brenneria roseae subsp. americana]
MDLVSMIDERLVKFDFHVLDKNDAISKIGQLMFEAGKINDKDMYVNGVFEREKEHSTGIGMGIAIPHCKSDCVREVAFTLIKLCDSIEWDAFDDQRVEYIIMLAAPNTSDNLHLKMLSQLAVCLTDDDFRKSLLNSKTVDEVKQCLNNYR